jgi:hypothetical protein
MFNLDTPPIILRQRGGQAVSLIVSGAAVILIGVGLGVQLKLGWVGVAVVLLGLLGAGVGFIGIRRPTMLTLSPEALVYVNLGMRRSWTWRDVGGFAVSHIRSATIITFRDYTAKPEGRIHSLPARWDADRDAVVQLLNAAQTKWS